MIKKIKTLLINPPFLIQERYGHDLKNFGAVSEPLGLAYLAASLEKNGFLVSIIDAAALNLSVSQIMEKIRQETPDLIGITVLTPMHEVVKKMAVEIKNNFPEVKIIVGGAHASAVYQEIIDQIGEIDYICVGEGEYTIVELVEHLSDDRNISGISGLVFRQDGRAVINQSRKLEMNLDELPPPARHLLPMEKYQLTASRTKGAGYCPTLIIARGCPFNCSYCSHPFGRTFRAHSVGRILEEIKSLMNKYDIKQMNLEADTLTANKNFLLALCQGLVDSGISQKLKWTCESRVDTIDEEMLIAMKKAGCWQISYGVESGAQRLLDLIAKGERIADMERVFALTKKIGIKIRGFFMLGLPTETPEESWQTINFAKKLNPLWAQFTLTIPYPGTPMFDLLKKENKIKSFDWSLYNTWAGWAQKDLPFVAEGRTAEELRDLQKKALISFYLRPATFFKFFGQINSAKTFFQYFFGFWVLVKNKISSR